MLVTEKNPIWVVELDSNLTVMHEFRLRERLFSQSGVVDITKKSQPSVSRNWKKFCGYQGPSDVSSIGYYNGKLFILSDEDSEILQVNPKTYALEKRWRLGILNPEGFLIDKNGVLFILSDNLQKIYRFPSIIS